jgi:aminopeptidase N
VHPARIPAALLAVAFVASPARAQFDPYDTGGPLLPEQASYDVSYYDLNVRVNPADSTLRGHVRIVAGVHSPIDWFVIDLDPVLDIESVSGAEPAAAELAFERRGGRVWIQLPSTRQPGSQIDVTVSYGGRPRIAPRPPWDGGLTWARTPSGVPWIATTCQQEGADVWWPLKEHVSDEPDSMAIRVTVPDPLVVATNGRFRGRSAAEPGWTTWDWFVSTPINTYNVALNIAPYVRLDTSFVSVAGDTVPVQFFVLPENEQDGRDLLPEILDHLAFFEDTLGPYPFRADKYGVAQTPHLGMEHQTIIAYGAGFRNESMTRGTDWGFDALHHHELSHEWWGNLVTNVDWSDMWLHEGFGSYMQPLYVERKQGPDAYAEYLRNSRRGIRNEQAVAPRQVMSGKEVYNGDIYAKGSWVLHTMRYLLGDDAFFEVLRRQAYPDPALEAVTDGRQTRFGTTDDFMKLAERISGTDLDWFFDVYIRQPDLPELVTERAGDTVTLSWSVPGDLPFPMPVDVRIGEVTERVDLSAGPVELRIPEGMEFDIDPGDRVLRVGNRTR